MSTDSPNQAVSQWNMDWSPPRDLLGLEDYPSDTQIQLEMLLPEESPESPLIYSLIPSQGASNDAGENSQPNVNTGTNDNVEQLPPEINSESINTEVDNETSENENVENHSPVPRQFDNEFLNMTETVMTDFINGQQNKRTMQKTVRDIALVTKFLKLKNEHREINQIPPVELDPLLATFVLTVRKRDGSEYEPTSLRSIISSVDRKLKRMKYGYTVLGKIFVS